MKNEAVGALLEYFRVTLWMTRAKTKWSRAQVALVEKLVNKNYAALLHKKLMEELRADKAQTNVVVESKLGYHLPMICSYFYEYIMKQQNLGGQKKVPGAVGVQKLIVGPESSTKTIRVPAADMEKVRAITSSMAHIEEPNPQVTVVQNKEKEAAHKKRIHPTVAVLRKQTEERKQTETQKQKESESVLQDETMTEAVEVVDPIQDQPEVMEVERFVARPSSVMQVQPMEKEPQEKEKQVTPVEGSTLAFKATEMDCVQVLPHKEVESRSGVVQGTADTVMHDHAADGG